MPTIPLYYELIKHPIFIHFGVNVLISMNPEGMYGSKSFSPWVFVTWLKPFMLRSVDNLILKGLAKVVEIIRITGNPYNQVCLLFRVFLRVTESIRVADVKLDVMAVHSKVGSYQCHEFFNPVLIRKEGRCQFLVQQGSAGF